MVNLERYPILRPPPLASFLFETTSKPCSRDMPLEGLNDHVSAMPPMQSFMPPRSNDQTLQVYLLARLHLHHLSTIGYLTVGLK
jgi:hypothetical protein